MFEREENLDEETKERRKILKKEMKKMLYERYDLYYHSFKIDDEKIEQEKEPLLIKEEADELKEEAKIRLDQTMSEVMTARNSRSIAQSVLEVRQNALDKILKKNDDD